MAASERPTEEKKSAPKIRWYFDFDGTVTMLPGSKLIGTPQYMNLLEWTTAGPDGDYDYSKNSFKLGFEGAPLKDLFDKQKKSQLSPIAIKTLKAILANPQHEIVFVSKNRSRYIQAVLESFLDPDQVQQALDKQKIIIYDVKEVGVIGKDGVVAKHHAAYPKPEVSFIFDDDKNDFNLMVGSIKDRSFGCHLTQDNIGNVDYEDIMRKYTKLHPDTHAVAVTPTAEVKEEVDIRWYIEFDGTLTSLPVWDFIRTEEYRNLQLGVDSNGNIKVKMITQ